MTDAVSRRGVLAGAAAFGTLAVAGCGSKDNKDASATSATTSPTDSSPASSSPSAAAAPLAKLADITVGSAVAVKDASGQQLIVARPTATTAVAFSASCTHKGCPVKPEGAILQCPCHGSRFAASTGDVIKGPAAAPLHRVPVKVAIGQVISA